MYVFCLFSPTFSANCDDDTSTPVAAQYAATLWFRADLLSGGGAGLYHPVTTPAANSPPILSRELHLPTVPSV